MMQLHVKSDLGSGGQRSFKSILKTSLIVGLWIGSLPLLSHAASFEPGVQNESTLQLGQNEFSRSQLVEAPKPAIIPLPDAYKLSAGTQNKFFSIAVNTPIVLENGVSALINLDLRRQWQALLQKNVQLLQGRRLDFPFYTNGDKLSNAGRPKIVLSLGSPEIIKGASANKTVGAYSLEISPNQVRITALDKEGFLYGLVSLIQLGLHNQQAGLSTTSLSIPCWQIQDHPAYGWRGIMLDESRHFFGKQQVEKLLTWMAYYKLNTFHWHLTDEPGWRIQIKAYPKLTTIGGIGNKTDSTAPAKYYTQAEIKEVIAYANALGITVVPEIDMPGHGTAANRAYPENTGGGTGKFANFTFNPGRDSTYGFLTNILREVQGLFGVDMVHLGGDEVSFGNGDWGALSAVKQLMANQHLKDNKEVEGYFLRRMADSALQFNTKILTWDEGVDAGLNPKSTIICWWRHDKTKALQNAIEGGFDVVMCPRIPLYFDFVQDSSHHVGRKWASKFASLLQVFNFFPADYTKGMNQKGHILGMQGNLWTETVQTTKRLDFMLFPRMAALATAGWTRQTDKDFNHFSRVLQQELAFYTKAGLYFYNPFDPSSTPEPKK